MELRRLEPFRNDLATKRYTILPQDVVISEKERLRLHSSVFREDNLEADQPEVHPDRKRADAVLAFEWNGDDVGISLGPNPSAEPEKRQVIRYTANSHGDREYKRLAALEIAELRTLILAILHLVPKAARRHGGLLGVHALRTFGQVVGAPHRDGSTDAPVDWVVSYVVAKDGEGSESRLTFDAAGTQLIARSALAPGQLMMHHDSAFFHYVTPLIGAGGSVPRREAVVVTIRPTIL